MDLVKKPLINFVRSSENVCKNIKNIKSNENKETKSSKEVYKEIISTPSNDKTPKSKPKTRSIKTIEFKCDYCGLVRSTSVRIHNLSIGHQLKADEFSKNIGSFGAYSHLDSNNRGYQLLKKEGWSGMSGLGQKEQGRKYPIKIKEKKDRLGIGYERTVNEQQSPLTKVMRKDQFKLRKARERYIEIAFRREFREDGII